VETFEAEGSRGRETYHASGRADSWRMHREPGAKRCNDGRRGAACLFKMGEGMEGDHRRVSVCGLIEGRAKGELEVEGAGGRATTAARLWEEGKSFEEKCVLLSEGKGVRRRN